MENEFPVRPSWVISSGAVPSFKRRTVALAVLPTGALPKAIVPGDATRVPIFVPFARKPPQADRPERRPQTKAINGAERHRPSWAIGLRLCAERCIDRVLLLPSGAASATKPVSGGGGPNSAYRSISANGRTLMPFGKSLRFKQTVSRGCSMNDPNYRDQNVLRLHYL